MFVAYYLDQKFAVYISNLDGLVGITSDAFNTIHRGLISVEVKDCAKLISIDARKDYPTPPLRLLHTLHFENLSSIGEIDFINSRVADKKTTYDSDADIFSIHMINLPKLKSLGLTRPLDVAGKNKIDLEIKNTPLLKSGMDMCFMRSMMSRYDHGHLHSRKV